MKLRNARHLLALIGRTGPWKAYKTRKNSDTHIFIPRGGFDSAILVFASSRFSVAQTLQSDTTYISLLLFNRQISVCYNKPYLRQDEGSKVRVSFGNLPIVDWTLNLSGLAVTVKECVAFNRDVSQALKSLAGSEVHFNFQNNYITQVLTLLMPIIHIDTFVTFHHTHFAGQVLWLAAARTEGL
jgi:hypothetical protein